MSRWSRFAVLAVLGAILSSALVVGCGGGGDDSSAPANNAPAPAK